MAEFFRKLPLSWKSLRKALSSSTSRSPRPTSAEDSPKTSPEPTLFSSLKPLNIATSKESHTETLSLITCSLTADTTSRSLTSVGPRPSSVSLRPTLEPDRKFVCFWLRSKRNLGTKPLKSSLVRSTKESQRTSSLAQSSFSLC